MAVAAQRMLFCLGIHADLKVSTEEDHERRKLMAIFHQYYPAQAYHLENESEVYTLAPSELQELICSLVPAMETTFNFYQQHKELVAKQEIYPGKEVIALLDIPEKIRTAGGVGLMMGRRVENVGAFLRKGLISTQDRYESGLLVNGASSSFDYSSGGGEYVFTRLVTAKSIEEELRIGGYPYANKAQVLVDISVLAAGGYAYPEDRYGEKNRSYAETTYATRKPLWEFAEEMNAKDYPIGNEVMIKNRIPPQYIRGLVVQDAKAKASMIEGLTKEGITQINGKPLDQCIYVSQIFQTEMWSE